MATALRPMNVSELLDRTFFLYRKHFIVFVGIVAIPYLFLLLFQLAFIIFRFSVSPIASIVSSLALVAIYLAAITASQAATIVAVSDVHLGRSASIGVAFAGIKENWLEIVFTIIFMGFGVLLGLICLIVPGIFLAIAWSLAIPAAVIESKGPFDSMRRSFALTKGSRLRISVALLLISMLAYVIMLIFQLPVLAVMVIRSLQNLQIVPVWLTVLNQIGSFVSSCLAVPLSTIAVSLIYYDQRVRKEGFDLQLMMSSLKSGQNPQSASKVF